MAARPSRNIRSVFIVVAAEIHVFDGGLLAVLGGEGLERFAAVVELIAFQNLVAEILEGRDGRRLEVDHLDDVQRVLVGNDGADLALDSPRLAPWTYGAEIIYSNDFSWGSLTLQGSGYRRDASAYTDNNLGQLREIDMFNARVAVGFWDDSLMISAFGRNLKDQPTIGGDTQLPFFPGSTFSPLNKGRTYGIEVQYRMD